MRRRFMALATCAVVAVAVPASGWTAEPSAMPRNGHIGNCAGCHGRSAQNRFEFDKAQSRILFRVDNHGYVRTLGLLRGLEGGFIFDPGNPAKSSVVATIRADSVDTANGLLDAVLRSARFFDAERFPVMTFKSRRIETTGADTGRIVGELTLRGVTRPVTLDVTFNKAGRHPAAKHYFAGFSAAAKLKRSDFGMTLGLPAIGDEVTITIEAMGKRIE